MNRKPTGRREQRWFGEAIVLERTFTAPIDDVWAAVTVSERLGQWIGTWAGDPTSGHVVLQMTAEGSGTPGEKVHIEECEPPRLLRARVEVVDQPEQEWNWELRLSHDQGATTLAFTQSVAESDSVGDVGPGWEYYLDRLVAAFCDQDVEAIDFTRDYHPAMSEHYRHLFA